MEICDGRTMYSRYGGNLLIIIRRIEMLTTKSNKWIDVMGDSIDE